MHVSKFSMQQDNNPYSSELSYDYSGGSDSKGISYVK